MPRKTSPLYQGGPQVSLTVAASTPVMCYLADLIYRGRYATLLNRDEMVRHFLATDPNLSWMSVRIIRRVLLSILPEPFPQLIRPGTQTRHYCWIMPDEQKMRAILGEIALTNSQVHFALYGVPLASRPSAPPEYRSMRD